MPVVVDASAHWSLACKCLANDVQNWDTLRDTPAPYKPNRADEISELLESVKGMPADDPRLPDLVKKLTANFDNFTEVGSKDGCQGPLLG